jgi:apolipoprotein D and lipocalin family protein
MKSFFALMLLAAGLVSACGGDDENAQGPSPDDASTSSSTASGGGGGASGGLGGGDPASEALETVAYVDVPRYLGTWYEIASFPEGPQAGCTGTTATYTLKPEGNINVLNKCYLGALDGQLIQIEGTASVADAETNAKLLVDFGFGSPGDYWVINLDDGAAGALYAWAVVSNPDRSSLFILSRTPQMDKALVDSLLEDLELRGFDLSRLKYTPQPAG